MSKGKTAKALHKGKALPAAFAELGKKAWLLNSPEHFPVAVLVVAFCLLQLL